jgi:putative transposase
MIKAHKIRLNPTSEQAAYFRKAAGTARFVFNWALSRWQERRAAGENLSVLSLKTEFNQIKSKQFPWVYEVTKTAAEGAFMNLSAALSSFFQDRKREKGIGFPKFKSKKRSAPAFYLANDKFRVDDHWIQIPKLGRVNMTEQLRFVGKIMSAVVSYRAGWWWVSIAVDIPRRPPIHQGQSVGVDVGIRRLAICSDGQVFENQKHLKVALHKVKRLQRAVSRKTNDSSNRAKAIKKLAKAHFQLYCKRQDTIHKMTTEISRSSSIIGLEDLNVKGMFQNHRLAQAVSDASLHEIKRQIIYKAEWEGGIVQLIDRFYPSSRLCNNCGYHNAALTLKDEAWDCLNCGAILDRDLNAARNIHDEALRLIAASR